MPIILNDISNGKVFPLLIINCQKKYLTLFYYNEKNDSILHTKDHLVSFKDDSELRSFCVENDLSLEGDTCTFNFDTPNENPVNYRDALDKWNLLNTISTIFTMFFEGNSKRYDALYDFLFCCSTSAEKIPDTIFLNEEFNAQLTRVFRRKNRLIDRFIYLEECDY